MIMVIYSIRLIGLVGAVLALWCCGHAWAAAPHNSHFETGDFSGWETIGRVSVEDGNCSGGRQRHDCHQALLVNTDSTCIDNVAQFLDFSDYYIFSSLGIGTATHGSALKQAVFARKGDVIAVDWEFVTNEQDEKSNKDFAFILITKNRGPVPFRHMRISLLRSDEPRFSGATGYKKSLYRVAEDGDYIVAVGVVEVDISEGSSALLVRNVSVTEESPGPGITRIPETGWMDVLSYKEPSGRSIQ